MVGDFAFALWDGRRLFCARDHFGVKPFFYSISPGCFIFSNTPKAVRVRPAVSDTLNERAVGDFLLLTSTRTPRRLRSRIFSVFLPRRFFTIPSDRYVCWPSGDGG